jgi:hypothetical protein
MMTASLTPKNLIEALSKDTNVTTTPFSSAAFLGWEAAVIAEVTTNVTTNSGVANITYSTNINLTFWR